MSAHKDFGNNSVLPPRQNQSGSMEFLFLSYNHLSFGFWVEFGFAILPWKK